MVEISQLPDPQREILRLLFFSPDRTATADNLKERCYYTDAEVTLALEELRSQNLVHNIELQSGANRPARWTPSEDMLDQMRALNSQADAKIRGAFDNAKRMLGDGRDN